MINNIPIFLDIDGVMQSTASTLAGAKLAEARRPASFSNLRATQATALLLRLQNFHAPKVQWWISSSWCNYAPADDLKAAFEDLLGFKNVHVCGSGMERLERVRSVLAELSKPQYDASIIIDDSSAFKGTDLESRWVEINSDNGFDATSYFQTLKLLGVKKKEFFLW